MAIPENKFDDWNSTGADKGSADARDKVKRALMSERSPPEQSDDEYEVYLQGSYKNTTHTRGSSDIDVVTKITSAWRSDLSNLTDEQEERYQNDHGEPDYDHKDFYDDVSRALRTKFGPTAVSQGDKAIKIDKEETSQLDVDVDVVACGEYRVYHTYPEGGNEDAEYEKGLHFMPRYGTGRIINFPSIHYQNGTGKHSNYKETVRIFKNARDYYNDYWNSILAIDAPSYFIECLIYNVPLSILQCSSMSSRFIDVLDHFEDDDTDLTTFNQVSEMELIFGDNNTQWDTASAERMFARLRQMWEDW